MSPKLLNILLVLITTALYFGYINPIYTGVPGLVWTPEKNIFILKAENVQYQNTLNQIDLVRVESEKLGKDYSAVDQNLKDKVFTMLPDSVDTVRLQNEVKTIANNAGVAIANLGVTPNNNRSSNPRIGSYTVTFLVHGKYAPTKRLIEAFEKNMRFYVIQSMAISKPNKKEGEQVSRLEDQDSLDTFLTFNVYYLK